MWRIKDNHDSRGDVPQGEGLCRVLRKRSKKLYRAEEAVNMRFDAVVWRQPKKKRRISTA